MLAVLFLAFLGFVLHHGVGVLTGSLRKDVGNFLGSFGEWLMKCM